MYWEALKIIKQPIFAIAPLIKAISMQFKYTKTFAQAIIICFFGVFLGCKAKKDTTAKPKPNPPVIVDVMIASLEPVSNTIEANGKIVANEFVELHPEVSGRLTFLHVPEGGYVTQGTVIAKINDADLRAQLGKTRVQLDLAEKTEGRYRQLLAINGMNQADYDVVINQINGYKADMVYTQALIDKTVIRAPFTGVAGLRQVSPGAYVTPATSIASLQQINNIKIDFTLPEEYSSFIKKGGMVDVQIDTQTRRKAIILAMEPQVNQTTRNLVVRAVMQGANANPGAFAKVYVDAGGNQSAIKVPTNALIADDKNTQLILVRKDKAAFVNVETGLRDADNVEITKGVKVGDTIVVTGVLFARPNSQLKVRSVKKTDAVQKQ